MELIYVIVGLIFLIGVGLAIYEKRKGLKMIDETDPNHNSTHARREETRITGEIVDRISGFRDR